MQMHVEAVLLWTISLELSLFSIAMSVPATRFLKILGIFKLHARFLTHVIDKAFTKKSISME